MRLSFFKRRWVIATLVLLLAFIAIRPARFHDPNSTVLLARNDELLGARVAQDGQWRFPESDSLPLRYIKAVTCFEDKHFFHHPGINPISIGRALVQNIKQHKVVSGGSTITMQLVRIARKGKGRNILEKLIESVIALRTELVFSKAHILRLYASHAPFGGNVVGIEAAAWRYFGIPPENLSWAEAATLAVLPNAPSLIYPGKNQERLIAKRNMLLKQMQHEGIIDAETCSLAMEEPVPGIPHPLPDLASHLLARSVSENMKGKRIHSTIDLNLQKRVSQTIARYFNIYKANGINNAAAVVLDIKTGEVLAYVGNTPVEGAQNGGRVDILNSERSYGSILKPLLYASMLNEGMLLPQMLVNDIPISISGYSPANYSKSYEGVVPANQVLARSLNVPSVMMLRSYGIEKFNQQLKDMGMTTLRKPASYYGLSIILGGAEGKLLELTSIYGSFAHKLLKPYNDSLSVSYSRENEVAPTLNASTARISPASIWFTLNAITEVHRPEEEGTWRYFFSPQKVGWKTGTSFGSRDAWAIGVTPKYAVGIWVGNADGEGRPGLTGVGYAAPVMFDIFALMPTSEWFTEPIFDMKSVKICLKSGHIAGMNCPETAVQTIPDVANLTKVCPYHTTIHLDKSEHFRVTDRCVAVAEMVTRSWFVLPPVQEYFYRKSHSDYQPLPNYMPGCQDNLTSNHPIGLIYPYPGTKLYLPFQADGTRTKTIWRASHRSSTATIFWHLDDKFIGKTTGTHDLEVEAEVGKHLLLLVDDKGESYAIWIEIIGKR
ncbi:penicillin-binding protein 1C [Williamwhitmania taraxaci]|uniref:peptidoglycan glycosyltransferase n=1 Tax=Williamwhitmania taraxaci TaxID=1640674 RepID=A0A1G6HBA9_9BACT|nr:penicillin-binding protein 1C [Williamwhitmania taraxaci]SDB91481.1 penicillin-binding protein 1C [Williamwhitmania taraxaci]